jgi:hypothetical protein
MRHEQLAAKDSFTKVDVAAVCRFSTLTRPLPEARSRRRRLRRMFRPLSAG